MIQTVLQIRYQSLLKISPPDHFINRQTAFIIIVANLLKVGRFNQLGVCAAETYSTSSVKLCYSTQQLSKINPRTSLGEGITIKAAVGDALCVVKQNNVVEVPLSAFKWYIFKLKTHDVINFKSYYLITCCLSVCLQNDYFQDTELQPSSIFAELVGKKDYDYTQDPPSQVCIIYIYIYLLYYKLNSWMNGIKYTVVSHFSKTISQTTTFWKLGLGLLDLRVILGGNYGFMAGVRFWRFGFGLGEVGCNHKKHFRNLNEW